MKRVSFAWVTEVIDFDNHNEAIKFVQNNLDKGWLFHDYNPDKYATKPYDHEEDYQIKMEEYLSKFVTQSDEELWTVQVQKPYGKYECGW
jgi:hypothetical protein